jgi:hypothetical protein
MKFIIKNNSISNAQDILNLLIDNKKLYNLNNESFNIN